MGSITGFRPVAYKTSTSVLRHYTDAFSRHENSHHLHMIVLPPASAGMTLMQKHPRVTNNATLITHHLYSSHANGSSNSTHSNATRMHVNQPPRSKMKSPPPSTPHTHLPLDPSPGLTQESMLSQNEIQSHGHLSADDDAAHHDVRYLHACMRHWWNSGTGKPRHPQLARRRLTK